MTEEAGHCLDVGAIVEDVDRKRMAGAVPGDMLGDAGRFNPAVDRLEAHGVRRQLEQERIEVLILGWLADETDDFIRKRNDNALVGRMTFGLVLLELKQLVGEIDIAISEIFDIAETEAAIEA